MANTPASPMAAASELAAARREWIIVGGTLAVGLAIFGYVFRPEIALALLVWSTSDAYNHCYLVLPVAVYLAWERREAIMASVPRPMPWIALLGIPVSATWFVADRLGIMEGRQLAAMTLLQVMVLALIGWAAWRTLVTPLLYLYFLVPFGEFVVGPLQHMVASFATFGLKLVGVPTYSDGIIIQIPEGSFLVHQACSGIRFLIASAAFGVLYSCVMYRSPLRRVVFSLMAIALAIVGNAFRVLGTILIAHYWGNVQAVEADHVIWGWGFYVIIGGVLILIGYRFRQEQEWPAGAAPRNVRPLGIAAAVAALAAMVLLAATPRVAADYLDRVAGGAAVALQTPMPAIPGCTLLDARIKPPLARITASGARAARYRCDGNDFELEFYRFEPRIGVRPLFVSLKFIGTPPDTIDVTLQSGDFRAGSGSPAALWRVTQSLQRDHRYRAIATSLWLNGRPSGAGIRARIEQALNLLRRAPRPPLVAAVTYVNDGDPIQAGRTMRAFLARTDVSAWVRRVLAKPNIR